MELTGSELAKATGTSRQYISKINGQGKLEQNEAGKYDLMNSANREWLLAKGIIIFPGDIDFQTMENPPIEPLPASEQLLIGGEAFTHFYFYDHDIRQWILFKSIRIFMDERGYQVTIHPVKQRIHFRYDSEETFLSGGVVVLPDGTESEVHFLTSISDMDAIVESLFSNNKPDTDETKQQEEK